MHLVPSQSYLVSQQSPTTGHSMGGIALSVDIIKPSNLGRGHYNNKTNILLHASREALVISREMHLTIFCRLV